MEFELTDVTNTIQPTIQHNYFNDEDSIEIFDTCTHLIHEFIKFNPASISEPKFNDILYEKIYEIIKHQFDIDIFFTDDAYEELENIIEYSIDSYFNDIMPSRSETSLISTLIESNTNTMTILEGLKNKVQPTQRTPEWYTFRHNLITASNAYKAFESQCVQNQLIYEKCKPLRIINDADNFSVNVNSTLHWGQKYEPISVLIYENVYNTKVADFGCIQHDKYLFLGASPDGINIDINSPLYGRMLEIKNIVNRPITGIPKKEYWIQTQLQMEVCNLDSCDFLETKFTEYANADDFWNDHPENIEQNNQEYGKYTIDNKLKGLFIYFNTFQGKPCYKYKPLNITDHNSIQSWIDDTITTYQLHEHNMTWISTIYWKLAEISCVLILRNKEWFNANIEQLHNIWKTIELERVTGYEHRCPKKKTSKSNLPTTIDVCTSQTGCLIKLNKSDKITIVKLDANNII